MNSKRKGKAGEQEAVHAIRASWCFTESQKARCIRSAQVSGSFAADIFMDGSRPGEDAVHVEVKRRKKIASSAFMEQAMGDAAEGQLPAVVSREDGGIWMVTIRLQDSLDFSHWLTLRT